MPSVLISPMRVKRAAPSVTPESIQRAKAAMHAERIAAGLCPVCEPNQLLDEFGCCPNPFCLFAAFAQAAPQRNPFAPSTATDPRR